MRKLLIVSFILLPLTALPLVALPFVAFGQTPLGGTDGYPPLPGTESPPPPQYSQSQGVELDPASVEQAEDQFGGDYPPLRRTGGGMIQEVWNNANVHAGVHQYFACDRCVYKIRTREFMSTTIKLPEGEEIISIDVGDPGHYKVRKQGKRIVALKPLSFGNDTSLIVYGKSGTVYPFYVRSEGYNSDNVPDLLVVIEDNGFREYVTEEPAKPVSSSREESGEFPTSTLPSLNREEVSDDEGYVREIAFDPSKIKGFGDYRVSGTLRPRPKVIFRDDQFTYIQFENWDGERLPTAYIVSDDIDYVVNTRVMGETYVIESVNDLISLKSGNRYLCIEYTGDKVAVADEGNDR